MMIRAVPDGNERDKDATLTIMYVVDMGAGVVKPGLGNYFSPERNG
jgi:hypothetical protein